MSKIDTYLLLPVVFDDDMVDLSHIREALEHSTLGEVLSEVQDSLGEDVQFGRLTLPDEERCPHGNPLGECTPCDVAGDLAFDSAREDRL